MIYANSMGGRAASGTTFLGQTRREIKDASLQVSDTDVETVHTCCNIAIGILRSRETVKNRPKLGFGRFGRPRYRGPAIEPE
jgi:hypothetical protein